MLQLEDLFSNGNECSLYDQDFKGQIHFQKPILLFTLPFHPLIYTIILATACPDYNIGYILRFRFLACMSPVSAIRMNVAIPKAFPSVQFIFVTSTNKCAGQ